LADAGKAIHFDGRQDPIEQLQTDGSPLRKHRIPIIR
jgi:hypothetical protein